MNKRFITNRYILESIIDIEKEQNLPLRIRIDNESANFQSLDFNHKYDFFNEGSNLTLDRSRFDVYKSTDYHDVLTISKNLQQNPFVVLIDPDITTIEDLNSRYNSYLSLSQKNKDMSDNFCWQLWGFNVYNMYIIMSNRLSSIDQIENEIYESVLVDTNIFHEKNVNKYVYGIEFASYPIRNRCINALFENNILEYFSTKWCDDTSMVSLVEKSIYDECNDIDLDSVCEFDTTILPTGVPYFNASEINICPSISRYKGSYISNIRSIFEDIEAGNNIDDNKAKLVSLGWNPEVKPTESNFNFAKNRQAKNNFYNPIDITSLYLSKIDKTTQTKLIPIYFVLSYKDYKSKFINISNYDHMGISFDINLDTTYIFNGVDNEFKGFIKAKNGLYIDKYIDVVVFYVDPIVYNELYSKVESLTGNKTELNNFGSIYGVLVNTLNKLSPDNTKLIYSQYIDLVFRLLNIDIKTSELKYDKFELMKNTNIFKVFSGNISEYNSERVANILQIISNENNVNNALVNKCSYSGEDIKEETVQERMNILKNYIKISPLFKSIQ